MGSAYGPGPEAMVSVLGALTAEVAVKVGEWQGWDGPKGVWTYDEEHDWIMLLEGKARFLQIVLRVDGVYATYRFSTEGPVCETLEDAANAALGMLDEWKKGQTT